MYFDMELDLLWYTIILYNYGAWFTLMYFDMELIYFDVLDTEQISLKIIDVLHYALL